MSEYRDELVAAHARIAALEAELKARSPALDDIKARLRRLGAPAAIPSLAPMAAAPADPICASWRSEWLPPSLWDAGSYAVICDSTHYRTAVRPVYMLCREFVEARYRVADGERIVSAQCEPTDLTLDVIFVGTEPMVQGPVPCSTVMLRDAKWNCYINAVAPIVFNFRLARSVRDRLAILTATEAFRPPFALPEDARLQDVRCTVEVAIIGMEMRP